MTNAFALAKKANATFFETNVGADVFVAGGAIVGDVVAAFFAGFRAREQPARAGPLLEATCCKKALGNDSILVEPGAWIIGSHRHFVNQTQRRIHDSFAAFATNADNGLIPHTIVAIACKQPPVGRI